MRRMALFFLALFLSPAFAQQPDLTEVLLDVPVLPVPVKANNKAQLLYELHITNFNVAVELTALPSGLYHRLFFKEENGREVSVESERVVVRPESVVVLNSPAR